MPVIAGTVGVIRAAPSSGDVRPTVPHPQEDAAWHPAPSAPTPEPPGRPPRTTDAELTALAVGQIIMGIPNDNHFLALARYRLGHLFPYE